MFLRCIWGIVSLCCLGCGSGGTSSPGAGPVLETRVEAPSLPGEVRIDVDRNPAIHRIGVSRTESWAVLAEVFDSLSIPLEFSDLPTFRAGNTRFIAPRRIAGQPKSAYLRCGVGPGAQFADSYRVTMSLITELRATAVDSTVLFTQVVASARPTEGVSTERVLCATTGLLERTLAQMVSWRALARRAR